MPSVFRAFRVFADSFISVLFRFGGRQIYLLAADLVRVLSQILLELNEEHKELLFLCAVRLFSSTRIAGIRGQSDRNIRKVRGTMFKKIRKKLLAALTDKAEKQQPMTLLEKEFLRECGLTVDNGTKKQYNR